MGQEKPIHPLDAAERELRAAARAYSSSLSYGGDKGFEVLFEITGQQGTDLSEKLVEARKRP